MVVPRFAADRELTKTCARDERQRRGSAAQRLMGPVGARNVKYTKSRTESVVPCITAMRTAPSCPFEVVNPRKETVPLLMVDAVAG